MEVNSLWQHKLGISYGKNLYLGYNYDSELNISFISRPLIIISLYRFPDKKEVLVLREFTHNDFYEQ
jgi:hypothetical protein